MRECDICFAELNYFEKDVCGDCERRFKDEDIKRVNEAREVMEWERKLTTDAQIDLYLMDVEGEA
jgi:hypothetical protein